MASDIRNRHDVRLLRAFVNTVDVEDGSDVFVTPDGLTAWLHEHDLIRMTDHATDADVALAHELRAGLRAEMSAHHGEPTDQASRLALDGVAADLPLRIRFGDEPTPGPRGAGVADGGDTAAPTLVPAVSGARAGLAWVLASVMTLARSGEWSRLKICPDESCGWAFYDESRNRSRRWCSMETCGNRAKLRAYRHRQAPSPSG